MARPRRPSPVPSLPGAEMPSGRLAAPALVGRVRVRDTVVSASSVILVALWSMSSESLLASCAVRVGVPPYSVPQPVIEALKPRGLRASLPDQKEITLMKLAISVNKPLTPQRTGSINVEVTHKTGPNWVYEDRTTVLRPGDNLFYWVQVELGEQQRYSRTGDLPIIDYVQIFEDEVGLPAERNDAGVTRRTPSPGQQFVQQPNNQSYSQPVQKPSQSTQKSNPSTQKSNHSTTQKPNHSALKPILSTQRSNYPSTQRPNQSSYRPNHTTQSSYQATQRTNPTVKMLYQSTQKPSSTTQKVYQTSLKPPSMTSQTTSGRPIHTQQPQAQVMHRPVMQNEVQAMSAFQKPLQQNTLPQPAVGSGLKMTAQSPKPISLGSQVALQQHGQQKHITSITDRPVVEDKKCERSPTSVNGKLVCRKELIFLENFDELDLGKWTPDVRIPGDPDHEFNVFTNNPLNTYVVNGQLVIRPTLTEDSYGVEVVRSGRIHLANCTAGPTEPELCSRQAKFGYILPPVMAGRISTPKSFSFRYGRLEIRAKLPSGDWLYPELWLRPRENAYGPNLQSGRIQIALSRGNQELHFGDTELGGRRLEAGVVAEGRAQSTPLVEQQLPLSRKEVSRTELPGTGNPWSDHFHNYTLQWTPDAMSFSVDGVQLGTLLPEHTGGFLVTNSGGQGGDPWRDGGKMAPFDREFYISIGLGAGGIRNFPDGAEGSNGVEKPWRNTAAKAMLSFWKAKDEWFRTWDSNSALLVDFVRVTAL